MKGDTCRTTFSVLCVVLLSGCALFSPVKSDTKQYVLNDIPLDLPSEQTHSATLLVLISETGPLYATTRMAYTNQAYQVAYFSQNEWTETPSQMIQPLIVETLRHTHYFSEVLPSPDFGRHTFVLRSEILDLKQDFTSDPAMLQLTMRFYLSREAMNQVIATKELSVREPMRERNPYAGVVAANEAMVKLLRELARLVVDKAN
ncbi:ABC-type transport auxiliary lipoprotein family protein [Paraburkholderia fungorum]|jgi:cholesterol transport system auxiliary component|uniref:ABC-type transport auxiliary lipoprotein family protein n=1 Tax=Paraburkholderia fungorum TaxID=134537 RepID=UPI0038B84649